jgi:hypothetical protein
MITIGTKIVPISSPAQEANIQQQQQRSLEVQRCCRC